MSDEDKQTQKATTPEKRSTDKNWFYPEHGVTIVAKSRKEADNLLKEKLNEKDK